MNFFLVISILFSSPVFAMQKASILPFILNSEINSQTFVEHRILKKMKESILLRSVINSSFLLEIEKDQNQLDNKNYFLLFFYLKKAINEKLISFPLKEFQRLLIIHFSSFLERNPFNHLSRNEEKNIEFFLAFIENFIFLKYYLNKDDALKISKKLFYVTKDVLKKRHDLKYFEKKITSKELLFFIELTKGCQSLDEIKSFFYYWFLTVFSHINQVEYLDFFNTAKKVIFKEGLTKYFFWNYFSDWSPGFKIYPEQELELFFGYSNNELNIIADKILDYMNNKNSFILCPSKQKIAFLLKNFPLDSMSFYNLVALIERIASFEFRKNAFADYETDFFDLLRGLLKNKLSGFSFDASFQKKFVLLGKENIVRSIFSLKEKLHSSSSFHVFFEGNDLFIKNIKVDQEEKKNNEDGDDLIFSFDDI